MAEEVGGPVLGASRLTAAPDTDWAEPGARSRGLVPVLGALEPVERSQRDHRGVGDVAQVQGSPAGPRPVEAQDVQAGIAGDRRIAVDHRLFRQAPLRQGSVARYWQSPAGEKYAAVGTKHEGGRRSS
ncbi:MAG TPA: hypothetical protein VFW96_19940 [Thermomicrobiales bacterium]|nr:hypothetical protein [Thermomicrobiales bacterium]